MSQRIREERTELPTATEIERRRSQGWRLCAVEWRRQGDDDAAEPELREAPYGLRVAAELEGLVADPHEQEVLRSILTGLVADRPLGEIAAGLNASGRRTRGGERWTQAEIFSLLPRLVEAGPAIFRSREWRRTRADEPPV